MNENEKLKQFLPIAIESCKRRIKREKAEVEKAAALDTFPFILFRLAKRHMEETTKLWEKHTNELEQLLEELHERDK